MRRWSFSKGHGTENDFVVLLDRDDTMHIGPAEVRYLCDRHAGIGGDGLLRAVRARHMPEWDGDGALWFMDYRNADGSVAQMCGNGLRVFARFLLDHDLASGPTIPIATRSGLKEATVLLDTRIRVSMGPVRVEQPGTPLTVRTADGAEHAVLPADVGNPHAVAFVAALAGIAAVQLAALVFFPSSGPYPFRALELLAVLTVSVLGAELARRARRGAILGAFFLVWGAASIAMFVVSTPVGENLTRLRSIVFPVMLMTAFVARFRPRWLTALALSAALLDGRRVGVVAHSKLSLCARLGVAANEPGCTDFSTNNLLFAALDGTNCDANAPIKPALIDARQSRAIEPRRPRSNRPR